MKAIFSAFIYVRYRYFIQFCDAGMNRRHNKLEVIN